MTDEPKKSKDDLTAARCGMPIEQWQRVKASPLPRGRMGGGPPGPPA